MLFIKELIGKKTFALARVPQVNLSYDLMHAQKSIILLFIVLLQQKYNQIICIQFQKRFSFKRHLWNDVKGHESEDSRQIIEVLKGICRNDLWAQV